MNKIYSLRVNDRKELVAVPETVGGRKKSSGIPGAGMLSRLLLASGAVAGVLFSSPALASVVGNTLPWQTYRDFAENKGAFHAGATNIPLYGKNGAVSGRLDKAPMMDFSVVDQILGVATLISPQYVAGVKHNGSYNTVRFGYADDTTYRLVDRNEHWRDFHTPRLNKLVTEVAPVSVTDAGTGKGVYQNRSRYPVFYRMGSGTQYTGAASGALTRIADAYVWRTGGTVGSPVISDWSLVSNPGNLYQGVNGPLASYGTSGDSGSPLFAWDAVKKQWVFVAVLHGYAGENGKTNWFTVIPAGDVNNTIKQDNSGTVVPAVAGGDIVWKYSQGSGEGTLSQSGQVWKMNGFRGGSLNDGKDITFGGKGTVVLKDDVVQGAGSLTFNGDYTVRPEGNQTWVGGGIIVNDGHRVDWMVNGLAGDALHKIGKGILVVAGSGENPGALNTGDGTVILAQKADAAGRVRAFSEVSIVSGRPVVVLQDSHQIEGDRIRWGYRGGTLDINGNDMAFNRLAAADEGAVLTSRARPATVRLDFSQSGQKAVMWHGHFTGNLSVLNNTSSAVDFIMDGGADMSGSFTQQGGGLYIQGHPVVHAVSSEAVATALRKQGDNSVLTQPVSFAQKDWESRTFSIGQLKLKGAAFSLSRNATLTGDIDADNATMVLGSDSLYLDMKDGTGSSSAPVKGTSAVGGASGSSTFRGNVNMRHSALTVRDHFTGSITASDSRIAVSSENVRLEGNSRLTSSALTVSDGGRLHVKGGLETDGGVTLDRGTLLVDGGSVRNDVYERLLAWSEERGGLNGSGEYDFMTGAAGLLRGYVRGSAGNVNLQNAAWMMTGNSSVKHLESSGSALYFSRPGGEFHTLTAGSMDISDSVLVMRTDLNHSDQLRVTESLRGKNNLLLVDFTERSDGQKALNIPLVTAPAGTSADVFSVKTRDTGFSHITPVVRAEQGTGGTAWQLNVVQPETAAEPVVTRQDAETPNPVEAVSPLPSPVSAPSPAPEASVTDVLTGENAGESGEYRDETRWLLTGYRSTVNSSAVRDAGMLMSMGHRNFINEVNNLNKRMGDLRDINGEAGAWARIMSGTGSAGGGFSDNYTHVQVGADKKHELDGLDLFTGVTMTYTYSNAGSDTFSGKTKSVGAGLYASALFDSGAHIDLIGKYVHHDNEYTASFAGLGTKDYSSHSWYAGAEVGYRYHVTEDAWIEPQAELVYGAVSGKQFSWKDQGMSLSMKDKDYNPLIGRTGVDVGKSFSGKDWKVTARAGLGYQFDLLANGETVLRDASGEKRIKGEKDGRMLMSVGLNAEVRDNIRFGLEFEKSAFGKYNVDNAVNASFRYSF
ncbi:TPA: S6 family peptidase [Escherichia coli]|nr:autotransporter outer membrane beta-barrel domain-containing protein [Escherichia coli]